MQVLVRDNNVDQALRVLKALAVPLGLPGPMAHLAYLVRWGLAVLPVPPGLLVLLALPVLMALLAPPALLVPPGPQVLLKVRRPVET